MVRRDAEAKERRDPPTGRMGLRQGLRRQDLLHRPQLQEDDVDRPAGQVIKTGAHNICFLHDRERKTRNPCCHREANMRATHIHTDTPTKNTNDDDVLRQMFLTPQPFKFRRPHGGGRRDASPISTFVLFKWQMCCPHGERAS